MKQLRKNPQVGQNNGSTSAICPGVNCRLDQPIQFYQPKKDHYRYVTPGFEVGGYLVKDRLWMFTSFAPEIVQQARTIHFGLQPVRRLTRTVRSTTTATLLLARRAWITCSRRRSALYGAWQYQYCTQHGANLAECG